jgi:hypothetical protein
MNPKNSQWSKTRTKKNKTKNFAIARSPLALLAAQQCKSHHRRSSSMHSIGEDNKAE